MIPCRLAWRGRRTYARIGPKSGSLFFYVDLEARVPAKHPLRIIRTIVNDVLANLDPEFERLYQDSGRALIAPERLFLVNVQL